MNKQFKDWVNGITDAGQLHQQCISTAKGWLDQQTSVENLLLKQKGYQDVVDGMIAVAEDMTLNPPSQMLEAMGPMGRTVAGIDQQVTAQQEQVAELEDQFDYMQDKLYNDLASTTKRQSISEMAHSEEEQHPIDKITLPPK